jgi:hypothetical protein
MPLVDPSERDARLGNVKYGGERQRPGGNCFRALLLKEIAFGFTASTNTNLKSLPTRM